MKSLIFTTVLIAPMIVMAETTIDTYIYGLSKHFVECKTKRCSGGEFNEVNKGGAVGVTRQFEKWSVSLRAGEYEDSYGSSTKHVLVGVQSHVFTNNHVWGKAGVAFGYVNGSDFDVKSNSAALFPLLSVGYKRVGVELTIGHQVVAGWFKISYPF